MSTSSQRLKYSRIYRQLTQADAAEKAGITRQSVTMYETTNRDPGFKTGMVLCKVYNVTPSFIAFGDATNEDEKDIEAVIRLSEKMLVKVRKTK